MIVCVAGKNDIAANVLQLCVKTIGRDNVLAIPNRDDFAKHTWQKSLKKEASDLGVKLVSLSDVYDINNLIFLSVEFDRILNPERFRTSFIYNIHFSLLPKYKGVYTAIWPLVNGEKETGVTLHLIEKGIDTGPIIDQVAFPIQIHDNARVIYFRCLELGYDIIAKNLHDLITGNVNPRRQLSVDSTYYSADSINFSNVSVNMKQTAYQLHNHIRAFSFQEYQFPVVHGYRISSSRILDNISVSKPGTIIDDNETCLSISTIDYDLLLLKDFSYDLFQGVENSDLDQVKRYASLVENINITNKMGWSPLMIAAYHNNAQVAHELIERGADINQTNKNGTTILMYAKDGAFKDSNTGVLDILINKKADINARDNTGKSVLDYCEELNQYALLDYFKTALLWINN